MKFVIILFLSVVLVSCKKEKLTDTNCNIQGLFTGTSTSSTGVTVPMIYRLQDNNMAVGLAPITSAAITFGGYENTCDSVYISVYYTVNSSYYLLKGKLLNGGSVINGVYNNLNLAADFGSFSIAK